MVFSSEWLLSLADRSLKLDELKVEANLPYNVTSMFPQKNRLKFSSKTNTNNFTKRHFDWCTFLYLPNQGQLQLSVVVSKKVSKKAVARNQIKRRITHAITKTLRLSAAFDILIFVKPAALTQTESHWADDLSFLIKTSKQP